MNRIASIIVASSFVAGFAAMPAFANSALDKAVERAVVQKKETKKVNTYNGHEFNIKPVSVVPLGVAGFEIKGQLSHHLRFRKDDQFYYTVRIDRTGTIQKFDEKIDKGGLTSMLLDLKAGEIVSKLTGGAVPSSIAEKGIEKAGRWLGGKLDGSWEGAARKVVIRIGLQVAHTYNLEPVLAPSRVTTGSVRDHRAVSTVRDHRSVETVRDHRKRPMVRDHRAN